MRPSRRGLYVWLGPDRIWPWMVMMIVAILLTGCQGESAGDVIGYEVLKKTTSGDGRFIMHILVDESATKSEVLHLAEVLRAKHAGKYIIIDIFDSREAHAWRQDESNLGVAGPAEEEFWRHYLVQINRWSDGTEIHWVAEGRDH